MNKKDLEVGMKVKIKDRPSCDCDDCQAHAGQVVIIANFLPEYPGKSDGEILSNKGVFFIRDLERSIPELPEHLFEI